MILNEEYVNYLESRIIDLQKLIADKDDTIAALDRWIGIKKEKCVKCRERQKSDKELIANLEKAMSIGHADVVIKCCEGECGTDCEC